MVTLVYENDIYLYKGEQNQLRSVSFCSITRLYRFQDRPNKNKPDTKREIGRSQNLLLAIKNEIVFEQRRISLLDASFIQYSLLNI